MNFRDKTNMEKAKKVIDDADNIGTITKIGNTYAPRIMLTYMNLTKEDDDDNDADTADTTDKFKMRIIEGLMRKNECLKDEIQNEDDLRVIQVRETRKNKKQTRDPKVQPTYKESD